MVRGVEIASIKMCQADHRQHGFNTICAMSGPGGNFNLKTSRAFPALIRKFHEAKERGASTVAVGVLAPLAESFCMPTA